MSGVDPRAIVSPRAKLGRDVWVAPYAVIGDEVELGDGCRVHSHVVMRGPARFGRENVFHSFAAIGCDPQDVKYDGRPSFIEAGDGNVVHEFVTIARGSTSRDRTTRIGSRNLFMAYSHIAHDCTVGNNTVFANGASLAGHVTVEDYATVGAFCPVHQFCRIGRYAYVGAFTVISQDVLPYSKVVAPREARNYGVNTIGLERLGYSRERLAAIERAFRLLLRSKLNTTQALERIRAEMPESEDVALLVHFIESSDRGLVK